MAGGTANLTNGFYVTDLVARQDHDGKSKTWTLDPAMRLRAQTDNGTGLAKTNHYDDAGSDSPDWIDEGDGTSSRYVTGLDGNLAAAITRGGDGIDAVNWQLVNLHGYVTKTATASASTPDGATLDTDPFGVVRTGEARYAWLGGKQRSSDALGGIILMGVRLYAPVLGRFLSVDPVPGGSANAYAYPTDPVNAFDLDGKR